MADFPMLRAQAPIVLRDGRPTPEFYGYLLGLDRALGTDYAAQFTALAARVAALEEGGALTLRGIGSITVRNGLVQLVADEDNPAGNSYYGANAAGERGFWPVVDALAAGIGLTKVAPVPWNVLGELDDTSQLPGSATAGDAYLIDGDYWVWGSGEWSNEGPPPNAATLGLYPGTAEDDALLWDPVAGDYVPAPALRNPLAAAGDLVRADGSAKPERLPVGTDGQVLTVVAGMPSWAAPGGGGGGGGGGGMGLLSEVVVSTAQTDIDFTGLDLEADKQYQIELFLVPNATGVQQTVRLQFNGDTTAANYRRRRITASGTGSVSSAVASDEAIVTATGGNTGQLAQPQKTTISIAKVPGVYPVADARTAGWSGTGQMWVEQSSVSRLDTENVTSIKLRHETANGFGVGTFARLYRL